MAASPRRDVIESLLAPAPVLPEQLAEPRRDSFISGERALMLAVLEDAIRCLEAPPGRDEAESSSAHRWVAARDDDWPFSFVNICEALGIDPGRLRAALLARRERRAVMPTAERYALHLRVKPRGARIRQRGRRVVVRDEPPLRTAVG